LPKEKNAFPLVTKDLYDIHEGNKAHAHAIFRGNRTSPKDLALFVLKGNETICRVSDVTCHSVSEWDRLIKPYMEE
jgi:hypothetical protein